MTEVTPELLIGLAVAILSSPVILALINRRPFKKSEVKLEEVHNAVIDVANSLDIFKKEDALKDFTSKTVRVVTGNKHSVTLEEWLTARAHLESLIPEEQWPQSLKEEVRQAKEIIRRGGLSE